MHPFNFKFAVFALLCAGISFTFTACNTDDDQPDLGQYANGVFIVNEGGFNASNSSITHFATNGGAVTQDVFALANSIPLGDVAQSMTLVGDKGYIVVNNSGKIEVVNWRDMTTAGTIEQLSSPRVILPVDDAKAYITQLYSPQMRVLDLATNNLVGSIDLGGGQEEIALRDGFAYVLIWQTGHVAKVNVATNTVAATANVGNEPLSMAFDANGKLWVLINDTYPADEAPRLVRINTANMTIEATFTFANVYDYPSDLAVSNNGQTLYFINGQVQSMSIEANALPTTNFIDLGSVYPYSLDVDPRTDNLWIGDAADYQSNGTVKVFSAQGTLIRTIAAGIIPGGYCFTPAE